MPSGPFLRRMMRLVLGDRRRRAEQLTDNGFPDEIAAVAWANSVLGPDAGSVGEVEQIKRLREARPGLDLGTATYIAKRRTARSA